MKYPAASGQSIKIKLRYVKCGRGINTQGDYIKKKNIEMLNGDIHGAKNQHHKKEIDDFISPDIFSNEFEQLLSRSTNSEMWKSRLIDLTQGEPKIDYLLKRNGIGCFSRGDFQVIKGKMKSGKSTLATLFITALLKDEFMGFEAVNKGVKILYVDTEQNRNNTTIMMQKLLSICGLQTNANYPTMSAMNLRGDNPGDRRDAIIDATLGLKPDFLIIDGIKDLLDSGDINNASECEIVIQLLMSLTNEYNMAILTILHENKGDSNLRGHLGSEIGNKVSEAWQIVNKSGVFIAEQIENRNERSGAISFRFQLDDKALPVQIDDLPKMSKMDETKHNKISALQKCLPQGIAKRHTVLKNEYMEVYGCQEGTADHDITAFKKEGYLTLDKVGKVYRFDYEKEPLEKTSPLPQLPTPII